MPTDTPARCREVFEHVVGIAPGARSEAIRHACGNDEVLIAAVEKLFWAHDSMGTFLEAPATRNSLDTEHLRVGRYQLIRKLGEGGTGRVYLADPGPVAVKLVRGDLDRNLVVRRFQREREMLARLDHPYIARLIDGGTTEDGITYLVTAYVDGVQLDDFCRRERLSLPQRLQLFRSICRAVTFAHERLVIHRDLKPANILVAKGGTPAVLDFGLAKLVQTTVEAALDSTTTGHRLLTPEYASPEQVSGHRITAASDIYSLGLILYELLVGVRAHRFTSWSLSDIVQTICTVDPLPPSIAARDADSPVSPDDLRGTLDAIVAKALAKVPTQRYSHVAALDDDLRRHLEGRAVPM